MSGEQEGVAVRGLSAKSFFLNSATKKTRTDTEEVHTDTDETELILSYRGNTDPRQSEPLRKLALFQYLTILYL